MGRVGASATAAEARTSAAGKPVHGDGGGGRMGGEVNPWRAGRGDLGSGGGAGGQTSGGGRGIGGGWKIRGDRGGRASRWLQLGQRRSRRGWPAKRRKLGLGERRRRVEWTTRGVDKV
ncbi:hypothetical protein PVAP13_1KG077277 [Panicum virgatum]|uniref:Uncharacterized protein n=1 Tax=Panicum virgatum TaxID=38727 RepID=A0A8T0XLN6_PANVG|nr:hypothetical protein PVAP13_1KG077277 [Panicum virgatum]